MSILTQGSETMLRPLTQEERDAAKENAKRALAGMQPRPEDFMRASVQEYPAYVRYTVTALCIAVLAFAFSISAIRLHHIAIQTFAYAVTDSASLTLVGWGIVFLAEIALVVSTLALVLVKSDRWMLYMIALLALAIAIVGNVQLAEPHLHGGLFAWLEAVAPPLFAICMAHILKHQMLHGIAARYAAKHAYDTAYNAWQRILQNADTHPDWQSKYANALKDALRKANARRQALAQLQRGDWYMLVQKEMQADAWYTSTMQSETERYADMEQQLAIAVEEKARLQDAMGRLQLQSSNGGTHTGEIATVHEGAMHTANCPHCGYAVEKQSARAASNALAAHLRGCKVRKNGAVHNATT